MEKLKRNSRLLSTSLLLLCLLFALNGGVYAVWAQTDTGSIRIQLPEQNTAENKGNEIFGAYKIANVKITENGLQYETLPPYLSDLQGISFDQADDIPVKTIEKLAQTAQKQPVLYESKTNGTSEAVFEDLPEGLYLITQIQTGSNQYVCDPFLVSVPVPDISGKWTWQITAQPKFTEEKLPGILLPDEEEVNRPADSLKPEAGVFPEAGIHPDSPAENESDAPVNKLPSIFTEDSQTMAFLQKNLWQITAVISLIAVVILVLVLHKKKHGSENSSLS